MSIIQKTEDFISEIMEPEHSKTYLKCWKKRTVNPGTDIQKKKNVLQE